MRKIILAILAILLCATVFAQQSAEPTIEKKLYNDGNVDYLPAGAKIKLNPLAVSSKPVTLYYSLDLGEITEYTESIDLGEEGLHWILYGGEDVFGDISRIERYSAYVDNTAPEFKYTVKGSTYVDSDGVVYISDDTEVLFIGEDTLSGLNAIYAHLDGYSYDEVASGEFISLAGAPDGEYYAEGFLVDNVGNKSDIIAAYAYLDNTAPTFNVEVSPEPILIDNQQYIAPDAVISITAEDNLSGVASIQFAIDDDNYMTYETDFRLPLEGNHTVKVFAVDYLGNISDIYELPIVRDTVIPAVEYEIEIAQ